MTNRRRGLGLPDTGTPWRTGTLRRRGGPRVIFGWSYEDERIELSAFGEPGRVCVIAAAGETAAACAAAGHRVTAVDLNPRQLAYCRRRLAGGPAERGVAEAAMAVGRTAVVVTTPAWRRRRLVRAMAAAIPAEAAAYWHDHLDRGAFPGLLRGLIGPGGLALRVIQPALAATVPERFDRVLRGRLADGLARHGVADNRFAWRLLAGRDLPGWRLPTTSAVRLVPGDVVEHLEQVPAGHYTGISLSNVLDGASPAFADRLRAAAGHALAPGGSVVLRSFAEPGPGPNRAPDDAGLIWGTVRSVHDVAEL